MTWQILTGDCIEQMRTLDDSSIDAVVCDPPYGIGFMGKEWDGKVIAEAAARDRAARKSLGPESSSRPGRAQPRSSSAFGNEAIIAGPVRGGVDFQAWCETWATEALRVLKPGGHLLAFGGPRTFHRLVSGVEDAGFEIRDSIMWLYGSGFPKSLDVSKAIDKAQRGVPQGGADPTSPNHGRFKSGCSPDNPSGRGFGAGPGSFMDPTATPLATAFERTTAADISTTTDPSAVAVGEVPSSTPAATANAERWDGWGTALKPAHEPVVVGRKPLVGTVAVNVLAHGTGALHIDACRIDAGGDKLGGGAELTEQADKPEGWDRPWRNDPTAQAEHAERIKANVVKAESLGRWPANVVLDPEAAAMLDAQTGNRPGSHDQAPTESANPAFGGGLNVGAGFNDSGGASRFFYCAKTSRAERNAGLDGFEERLTSGVWGGEDDDLSDGKKPTIPRANVHPTVKPINLMRWLVRLVTPPGGAVLDPFTGSGSTGCAAVLEGFDFIGCEREEEYVAIAEARIAFWAQHLGREVDEVLGLVGASEKARKRHEEMGHGSLFDSLDAEAAA